MFTVYSVFRWADFRGPLHCPVEVRTLRTTQRRGQLLLKTFKENICVICGRDESYVHNSIVPHDYRRYFPVCMKDHHCHDILLMCSEWHSLSNFYVEQLRQKLAKQYSAPCGMYVQNYWVVAVVKLWMFCMLRDTTLFSNILVLALQMTPDNFNPC